MIAGLRFVVAWLGLRFVIAWLGLRFVIAWLRFFIGGPFLLWLGLVFWSSITRPRLILGSLRGSIT